MIDLRNKEMGRMLNRELQAHFVVIADADVPPRLSELLDRLRESDDTTQGADLANNSASERTRRS